MAMDALPEAPSTSDPTTFAAKADAMIAALPGFVTQANALEANVVAKEATATAAAAAAAASATSAAGASGAAVWSSGSYNSGQTAYSPINFQTYRARTTGAKPTDPSLDAANWAPLTVGGLVRIVSAADPAAYAVAYQEWADTANGLLKQRNAANNAWITIGSLADIGIQSGIQSYAAGAGTAIAITADFTPNIAASIATIPNGMMVRVRATAANTGAVTFSPDGLTAKSLYKGANAALEIGDIGGVGHILVLRWDQALDKWELVNPMICLLPTQFGNRNKIINGAFNVNQRVHVSGAVLAAGSYGHDRWKAGASGGDYTFGAASAVSNTITIAAGKSLIQVVPNSDVCSATWVLSWTGTAQARVGLNSATPAGSYAASPILISGQSIGSPLSVEFNTGTLAEVQLEPGAIRTPFEFRPQTENLRLCKRFFRKSFDLNTTPVQNAGTAGAVTTICSATSAPFEAFVPFDESMEAAPTVVTFSTNQASANWSNNTTTPVASVVNSGKNGITIRGAAPSTGAASYSIHYTASAEL